MSDPLFAVLPGPAGPLRSLVDARTAGDDGADPVLLHVVRSLADRIDYANAGRQYRGYVMITAEFRAAYRDLLTDVGAADDDLSAALAEFRAAEARYPSGPHPAD
jgi:hypothetical protein